MDEGVLSEGAGEVGAGVQTRFGVGWRQAGGSLRFRDWTGSRSDSISGSAPATASVFESKSSVSTATGRWVEGGGEGVFDWLDNDWAAQTRSSQLVWERAVGSISRSSQITARIE